MQTKVVTNINALRNSATSYNRSMFLPDLVLPQKPACLFMHYPASSHYAAAEKRNATCLCDAGEVCSYFACNASCFDPQTLPKWRDVQAQWFLYGRLKFSLVKSDKEGGTSE